MTRLALVAFLGLALVAPALSASAEPRTRLDDLEDRYVTEDALGRHVRTVISMRRDCRETLRRIRSFVREAGRLRNKVAAGSPGTPGHRVDMTLLQGKERGIQGALTIPEITEQLRKVEEERAWFESFLVPVLERLAIVQAQARGRGNWFESWRRRLVACAKPAAMYPAACGESIRDQERLAAIQREIRWLYRLKNAVATSLYRLDWIERTYRSFGVIAELHAAGHHEGVAKRLGVTLPRPAPPKQEQPAESRSWLDGTWGS